MRGTKLSEIMFFSIMKLDEVARSQEFFFLREKKNGIFSVWHISIKTTGLENDCTFFLPLKIYYIFHEKFLKFNFHMSLFRIPNTISICPETIRCVKLFDREK